MLSRRCWCCQKSHKSLSATFLGFLVWSVCSFASNTFLVRVDSLLMISKLASGLVQEKKSEGSGEISISILLRHPCLFCCCCYLITVIITTNIPSTVPWQSWSSHPSFDQVASRAAHCALSSPPHPPLPHPRLLLPASNCTPVHQLQNSSPLVAPPSFPLLRFIASLKNGNPVCSTCSTQKFAIQSIPLRRLLKPSSTSLRTAKRSLLSTTPVKHSTMLSSFRLSHLKNVYET